MWQKKKTINTSALRNLFCGVFVWGGEIRFANLALMSGRQMTIHASMMVAFLVAITKNCRTNSDTAVCLFILYMICHFEGIPDCIHDVRHLLGISQKVNLRDIKLKLLIEAVFFLVSYGKNNAVTGKFLCLS